MRKLELEKFGVRPMSDEEMQIHFGGIAIPKWLKGGIWSYVAMEVIDHWSEIKQGFAAGYKAKI